jgi:UDP-glucose 4-epimerase
MKCIVTGGCGFIGSNLVDKLVTLGHDVIVIDDLSSGKKEYCNSKAKYIFDDFKVKLLENNIALREIDVIFHLAAEARIQPSFEMPLYTCENNSYGTAVVCEFARSCGAKIIYAGSSSFYGGVYENPYAFAKWQGEEVCRMYSKVYGVSSGVGRFFNVYGPRNPVMGQYTPVVAIFEEQMRNGNPLTIVGDGNQRRDFTHVYDICEGLIEISKNQWHGDIFNLGTGVNYSINDLADMFGGEKIYIPSRPGEAQISLADISQTTQRTGWRPRHSLKDHIDSFLESMS